MLFSGVSVVWFIAIKSLWSAVAVGSLCALIALFAVREWRRSKRRVTAAVAPADEAAEDGAAVLIDESSEDEAGYDTDLSEESLIPADVDVRREGHNDDHENEDNNHQNDNDNADDDGPLHLPASPKTGLRNNSSEQIEAKPEAIVKHTVEDHDHAGGSDHYSDLQPSTPSEWSDEGIPAQVFNNGANVVSGSVRGDGANNGADVSAYAGREVDEESKSDSDHGSVIYDLEQTESGSEHPSQLQHPQAVEATRPHAAGKAPTTLSSVRIAEQILKDNSSSSEDSVFLSEESLDIDAEDFA
jgi:hypothetical protein